MLIGHVYYAFPLSQAQCLGNKYPRVQMRNGVKHRDEVFCPRPHKAKTQQMPNTYFAYLLEPWEFRLRL